MTSRRLRVAPLHDRAQVASQLAALDLTEELLADALRFAYGEGERCTGNDVNMAGGIDIWGKPLRYLRDQRPEWPQSRQPDLEGIIHPSRAFRITSARGNWATGDPEWMPSTETPKGRLTLEAIQGNGQMALDVVGVTQLPAPVMKTYYLLHHLDKTKEEIRCELSIPTHMKIGPKAKKGRIDEFGPRLILAAIPVDSDADLDQEDEVEFSDDLDIQIPRRASQ
jgi:hypothetical protein